MLVSKALSSLKRWGTDFNTGYNAATGEFEDLIAAGIIDPAKVVRSALQNAGSIAGMVLNRGTGS